MYNTGQNKKAQEMSQIIQQMDFSIDKAIIWQYIVIYWILL
jgi:hypothetical protein